MTAGRVLQIVLETANLGWMDDALCAQVDSELFFPEVGANTRSAKRICAKCPVKAPCLDYALATRQQHGIWGGLSDHERRGMQARSVAA